jgi:hypothetical protein
MSDYKKQIEWDKGHKLAKVFQKKDKNGNTYFMGEFNFTNTITIRKNTSKWAKEGEWEIQIVPIKFIKDEGAGSNHQENVQNAQQAFDAVNQDSEAPF